MQQPYAAYSTITVEELKRRLDQGETPRMIDVREDEEVVYGMVPGALHIPMGDIPSRLEDISKTDEVIFICRSGNRSGHVCDYLHMHGYKGVTNMIGGMLAWHAAGYE